jgi:hypothetical protein
MTAIRRAVLRKLITTGSAALLAVGWCAWLMPAGPAAAATTITVNGTQGGRTFDGIGAISGGGGNSRLLSDYPATQQQQILDYLFKPGYGADLQILKVEIGGDTNSTDGSESSHMHTASSVNCNNGYEWSLMQQAKARNPNIKLYGLAWGAPGWIGGSTFFTTGTINYLVNWLNCAKSKGLTINYLGGWNERGYSISWYEQLRSTLNADGYSSLQIVGSDDGNWNIANDLVSNSSFSQAVQIIGAHYPCGYLSSETSCPSTSNAVATGKQLWASENGSQDFNSGAAAMARADNRDYLDGKMTATINWPLIAAIYPDLPFNHRDDGRLGRADRQLHGHRRAVHGHRARVEHQRQLGRPVDLVRALRRHHAEQRQLLADRPARLRLFADHDHRPGQRHRRLPAQGTLSLPYSDNFDGDTAGQQPRYLSQMQGAFEVEPCTGGRSGQCLQQQAPVQPIEWDGNSNPYTIGGNLSWANYTVSADALVEQAGAVQLIGRAGTQYSFGPAGINEYAVRRHRPRPRQVPGHHQRRDRQRHARRAVTGPTTPHPSPPPAPSAVAGQR